MVKKKVVYKMPDGGYITKDVITGTRPPEEGFIPDSQ